MRGRCGRGGRPPKRAQQFPGPTGGAGTSPTTPVPTQSASKPTRDPSPEPRTPPVGRPGSDRVRWRQVATGDHGNPRCTARLDPASASRSHSPEGSGTSPEKRRRRKRPKCRRGWGREAAGSGLALMREGGGLGLASVLPRPPARQSISLSVRPSSRPPLPGGRLLSPASCGLRLSSDAGAVPSPEPQPIAALVRGASGPFREGRPGRCLSRGESAGRAQARAAVGILLT